MGQDFFLPYLYVPSASASYVIIVTPWGNLQLEKDLALKIAVAVGVIVATFGLYRVCSVTASKEKIAEWRKKTTGVADEDDEARSALADNIIKKGQNSYYYAHQVREVKDTKDDISKTMVSSYGWTDNKKTVSIYLTDSAVKDMEEEQLILKWTNTSLSMDLLTAVDGKQAKSLVIPTLYHEITDVKWKIKNDRLTLTLTKAQELPWTSLNGAAKNLEDHIDYDESLYD